MIAVVLTEDQYNYLTYVFQRNTEAGLPVGELAIAAEVWKAVSSAQKFELPEKETHVIDGPLSLTVNGDMTLPVDPNTI